MIVVLLRVRLANAEDLIQELELVEDVVPIRGMEPRLPRRPVPARGVADEIRETRDGPSAPVRFVDSISDRAAVARPPWFRG